MFFKLSILRAIHGTMMGAGAAAGQQPPAAQAPPPAARTRITHVGGDPARKIEDKWQLPGDSPLVTSFPFLRWVLAGAPQTASVTRSSLAGTLMLIARRPDEAEWLKLDDAPHISTELDAAVAEGWAGGHTRLTRSTASGPSTRHLERGPKQPPHSQLL